MVLACISAAAGEYLVLDDNRVFVLGRFDSLPDPITFAQRLADAYQEKVRLEFRETGESQTFVPVRT